MTLDNEFVVRLAHGELDLAKCLSSGQLFRFVEVRPGLWVGIDGSTAFRIHERQDSEAMVLTVQSNQGVGAFERMFRLEQSFAELATDLAHTEACLEPILRRQRGLRQLRAEDPAECLFAFLCTANNHLKRIRQMIGRLAAFGDRVGEIEGVEIVRFPSVQRIAALSESELRALGFGYRAGTIVRTAQILAERPSDWLRSLAEGSYDAAHRELMALPGIGPKLADCICLYGLHFDEAVPIDTHLWQAACREFFPEWRNLHLTPGRYAEIGDRFRARFGKRAGWAQLLLYFDNMQAAGTISE